MDSLYLLIPIALIFCVIAIRLLLWAISSGQYDDLDKEGSRILMDDSLDDSFNKNLDQHTEQKTPSRSNDG
ncbi:MAG: cbb3-type cytochrome oxidase assembly protein CcoS [Halioglobus sp.]